MEQRTDERRRFLHRTVVTRKKKYHADPNQKRHVTDDPLAPLS
jgi:hypothetical protein